MAEQDGNQFNFGRLEILENEQLGSGAYGCICRARAGQLLCAAKILHHVMLQSNPAADRVMQRFHLECQILKELRHPNIVQYIASAFHPTTGAPVLFMELLDCSLTHFLEEQLTGPLSYHLLIGFSSDIAIAVDYLHHNGILHRDLSSNNVLLLGGVRAKVSDFGVANLLRNLIRSSHLTMVPGAAVYMPPEALASPAVYTNKLDIFSIGVLFIQMMTRRFPDPIDAFRVIRQPDNEDEDDMPKIMVVSEVERRRNDIKRIDPNHPLLPIAIQCLKNKDVLRPAASDLCVQLCELKSSPRYEESRQRAQMPVHTQLQQEEQNGADEPSNKEEEVRGDALEEVLGDKGDGEEVMSMYGDSEEGDSVKSFVTPFQKYEECSSQPEDIYEYVLPRSRTYEPLHHFKPVPLPRSKPPPPLPPKPPPPLPPKPLPLLSPNSSPLCLPTTAYKPVPPFPLPRRCVMEGEAAGEREEEKGSKRWIQSPPQYDDGVLPPKVRPQPLYRGHSPLQYGAQPRTQSYTGMHTSTG